MMIDSLRKNAQESMNIERYSKVVTPSFSIPVATTSQKYKEQEMVLFKQQK